ncbi:integrase core domain-containing protein [Desulfofundulus thermocisternus]|uniref:integrase core domain-containing protein n=1 Tax=Desulfofundulus thermocisternus TaxID=42471 RepID=UPI0035C6AEE3
MGIEHERISFKTSNKNAHIEAFHSTLEEECLSRNEFQTYAEVYQAVTEYIGFYNEIRIHSGINYLSPREFHRAYNQNSMNGLVIKA